MSTVTEHYGTTTVDPDDPLEPFRDDFVTLWATLANDPGEPQFVASWRMSQDSNAHQIRIEAEWHERIGPGPWDFTTAAERWAWPLPTEFGPRPFQVRAFERAYHRHLVLDHGMSAGKSSTILATLEALGAKRVLILAPSKVLPVWTDEFADNAARQWVMWAGKVKSSATRTGHLKDPSVAKRCEALIQANADALRLGWPFAAVVNYEALSSEPMRKLTLDTSWDALVCDESHRLALSSGVWSKHVAKVAQRVRDRGGRVLEGTGTFLPHSALSCFGQMRVLNPQVLGQYVTPFRARYAAFKVLRRQNSCPRCFRTFDRPAGSGCPVLCKDPVTGRIALLEAEEPLYLSATGGLAKTYKIPGGRDDRIPEGVRPEREQELMDRLAPWVDRVSQDEVDRMVGLVGAEPELRTIALDPDTRKIYDSLESGLIAQYNAGTIASANAMTNFGALLRVANGHGRDAGSGDMVGLHLDRNGLCAKARLLLDELSAEDPREPIVVFANWQFDFPQIERVCQKLGRRYGELSGRRSDGLHGKSMADDIDLLAVQWLAGSEGLSFIRARHEIDYSLSTASTPNTQAPRRLNRQGQTRHVTRRILAIEDSVEINWFYALRKRVNQNEAALERLTRRSA